MHSSQPISNKIIEEHGLSTQEYDSIVTRLKRPPNITELGMFSVMWSEHCSYKNSRHLLKKLSFSNKNILIGSGEENAGVIDIGDGWGIVFKVESHNHPSAIEPYQGAATGVGGIVRDIFTMGARPIASLNSLRFGSLKNKKVEFLFKRVVEGIADYGNCIGIPTVGGDVMIHPSYESNPLVNVFCLGAVPLKNIVRGNASGVGNSVLYVGSLTGRDGIHGATFASGDLTEESEEKKSAVQVGDPFMEKLLLEACLEVLQKKLIVGLQDLGAGGLTCAVCETADRGETGIKIDVSLVPRREKNMTPYEIMLSESQERMLLIVEPSHVSKVEEIFLKWDLNVTVIGHVTDNNQVQVFENQNKFVDLPVKTLTSEAPVYIRETKKPDYLNHLKPLSKSLLEDKQTYTQSLLSLLASPNISNKAWIYEQFDHMVGTNTVVLPGSDASVVRLKGTQTLISMSIGGNGRYCYFDPYEGAKIAVAEVARNVVCSGARPIGATDCLNFGNPFNPEIFWTFDQCISGIKDACSYLDVPIIGGNVSLYNQTPKGPIFPTPVIAVVGLIEKSHDKQLEPLTQSFKNDGDIIILLGETKDELGASEFSSIVLNQETPPCPQLDLKTEKKLYTTVLESFQEHLIESMHDCSEGGIAVTLAESCLSGDQSLGAEIHFEETHHPNVILFSESQSRIVISSRKENLEKNQNIFKKHHLPFTILGTVRKEKRLTINQWIDCDIADLKKAWTFKMDN